MAEEIVVVVTKSCMICNKRSEIEMTPQEYLKFTDPAHRDSSLIQDIFPDWSPGKRELLITGIHEVCWDILEEADYLDLGVEEGLD